MQSLPMRAIFPGRSAAGTHHVVTQLPLFKRGNLSISVGLPYADIHLTRLDDFSAIRLYSPLLSRGDWQRLAGES